MVDPYLYLGSQVLRNKLNITTEPALEIAEREIVAQRTRQGVPGGRFDLAHLQKIHRHLFQDIYDWAGEIRTVEISKGGSAFQARDFISVGMADVHHRLVEAKFLRGLSPADFAKEAGRIMGDVNYVHPFREGNGRAQLQYLRQLGAQADHPIDLVKLSLEPGRWIEASKASHTADYSKMADAIREALTPGRGTETGRDRGGNGRAR